MAAQPKSSDAAEGSIARVRGTKLVKTFGATAALRGVDVLLEPGVTLIEGANGSGKTTLLRILGTMLGPTSGEVVHEPLGNDLTRVRRSTGWLSHEALAYGELSGRANVELASELLGLDPSRAWDRVRERFELGAFAERPLRTMSRGQRQRIALARALVHEPSLLLLDEPTTGLDRVGAERLLAVVTEEAERGAIVALVTHEPRFFAGLVSGRIELERGRVVKAH